MSVNKIKIHKYLNELKNQINENTNLIYVLLRLDNDDVDELTDILREKSVINYILMNIHQENPIIDEYGDSWSLCITGFKHGARKNSPRKLGLLAYRERYLFDFKTMIFYNSETYNKYDYTSESKKGVINYIISNIDQYLENTTNYNSNVNYVKPEKKVKEVKKVKKNKKVIKI
jgi:hypothetical protein